MSSITLPEVDDYLLCFADIEGEIIVVAPVHQIPNLSAVLSLVIVCDFWETKLEPKSLRALMVSGVTYWHGYWVD